MKKRSLERWLPAPPGDVAGKADMNLIASEASTFPRQCGPSGRRVELQADLERRRALGLQPGAARGQALTDAGQSPAVGTTDQIKDAREDDVIWGKDALLVRGVLSLAADIPAPGGGVGIDPGDPRWGSRELSVRSAERSLKLRGCFRTHVRQDVKDTTVEMPTCGHQRHERRKLGQEKSSSTSGARRNGHCVKCFSVSRERSFCLLGQGALTTTYNWLGQAF